MKIQQNFKFKINSSFNDLPRQLLGSQSKNNRIIKQKIIEISCLSKMNRVHLDWIDLTDPGF